MRISDWSSDVCSSDLSNGGLVAADAFRGKDEVLSGPAGGIVGMVKTAEAAGFGRLVGFDIGGNSTDVSWYAGSYARTEEAEVAGVRLRTRMVASNTCAPCGGRIRQRRYVLTGRR